MYSKSWLKPGCTMEQRACSMVPCRRDWNCIPGVHTSTGAAHPAADQDRKNNAQARSDTA
jgi:hypothetical protein